MTRRLYVAFATACLSLIAIVAAALAHAELVSSDPPDGGTIQGSAYTMTITFDEPIEVDGSGLTVRNDAGEDVATGRVDEDDPTSLTADLAGLEPGEYRALWQAATSDGHTERGRINFTVAAAATTSPAPSATPDVIATAAPSAAATGRPTASPAALPTPVPSVAATQPPATPSDPTAGGADPLLALGIAGVAIGGLAGYLFMRSRR